MPTATGLAETHVIIATPQSLAQWTQIEKAQVVASRYAAGLMVCLPWHNADVVYSIIDTTVEQLYILCVMMQIMTAVFGKACKQNLCMYN